MKRRGLLLPIDRAIIGVLDEHKSSRPDGLHGYELARLLSNHVDRSDLTPAQDLHSNGTVYKALSRLRRCGALSGQWEDPDVALEEGRPRRRYHVLTENGLARARNLDFGRGMRLYLSRTMSQDSTSDLYSSGLRSRRGRRPRRTVER
jgi:DNA-binding PadR family transcriptional regulator